MLKSLLVYSTSFGLSLVLIHLYQRRYPKSSSSNTLGLLICIAPVVVTATCRFGIGTDYFSYVKIYNDIASKFTLSLVFGYYKEPMNVIFNYLSYILFRNEVGVFFLYSVLTMFFIVKGIENFKLELSMPLALFIFFATMYHISYNLVRQMLAVSIVFYAFRHIINRNLQKYILLVLFASLVHKSAIISVVFYFLAHSSSYRHSYNNIMFYSAILLTPVFVPILAKVIARVALALRFYDYYVAREGDKAVRFLLYIVPVLLPVIIYRTSILAHNKKYDFLIKTLCLQIPLQFLGRHFKYADRLSLYPAVAQVILLPIMIKCIRNKSERLLVTFATFLWYLFYYVGMFVVMGANEVYPYRSVLDLM